MLNKKMGFKEKKKIVLIINWLIQEGYIDVEITDKGKLFFKEFNKSI